MKCRTCASNFAAETTPRDIETLIGIILPLKKYRCRGCYTRSWHIDRKLLRRPRVIFWIPFWTFFIYGLVKGITNESYEVVETSRTGVELATVKNPDLTEDDPTATTPLKSFGEILENADANRSPTITVTSIETNSTIDIGLPTIVSEQTLSEKIVPENTVATDAPDSVEQIEELTAETTLPITQTENQLVITPALSDAPPTDGASEPVQIAQIKATVQADE
jgi:hypothetical protein